MYSVSPLHKNRNTRVPETYTDLDIATDKCPTQTFATETQFVQKTESFPRADRENGLLSLRSTRSTFSGGKKRL